MDLTTVDSTSASRYMPFTTAHTRKKSFHWTNARSEKILNWIETHDPKYILPGVAFRTAAIDLHKDEFAQEDIITVDKVRARLIQMKSKYEDTLKWLQLQKQSHETDKRKSFDFFLIFYLLFLFFDLKF